MDFRVAFEPVGRRVSCPPGATVLEAARAAGVRLASACGGQGTCGKCRVLALPPGQAEPGEADLLDPEDLARGYRLACRLRVDSDLTVLVPVASLERELRLQTEDGLPMPAVPRGGLDGVPVAAWYHLALKPPARGEPLADATRILTHLREDHGLEVRALDPAVAREMEAMPRAAAVRGPEVIALSVRPGRIPVGLAVDLGTTKIAAYLVDLRDGGLLAAAALGNPQIGADIVSRLTHGLQGPGGAAELRRAALDGVNGATRAACSLAGLEPRDILEVTLVGNTAMHHLLLGLPVDRLAVAPFVPVLAHPLLLKARELGLAAAPGARVFLPPPIAGYVGSDHLALLEALEIRRLPGNHLAVDVGTNTELTLKTAGGRLFTCSCASGPAFEGARIRHGMRAAPGAVERVRIDAATGRAEVGTVLEETPLGICGTGILEAVAELRGAGLLGPSGGLVDGPGVRRGPDGSREYLLAAGEDGEITVAQRDIQEALLAKGAIRAGIEVLLQEAGVDAGDLACCWVAGAFGTRLDPAMAVRVGMFPAKPVERFRAVGNAAAAGARVLLVFPARRLAAEAVASQVEYRELGSHPAFAELFARALTLP